MCGRPLALQQRASGASETPGTMKIVQGAYAPTEGHRFNHNKLLLACTDVMS